MTTQTGRRNIADRHDLLASLAMVRRDLVPAARSLTNAQISQLIEAAFAGMAART